MFDHLLYNDSMKPSNHPILIADRSGNYRSVEAIASDRNILEHEAKAWAKTPKEAEYLASGCERIAQAVWWIEVRSNVGTPSGSSTMAPTQEPTLISMALPITSLLAIAGKAASKKALLEVSARSGGASSPWFGIACERIAKSCLSKTMHMGTHEQSPMRRDGLDAHEIERSIASLSSSWVDRSDPSGIMMLKSESQIPAVLATRLLDEFSMLFGKERLELPLAGHASRGAGAVQAIHAWLESLQIERSAPIDTINAPAKRPSL